MKVSDLCVRYRRIDLDEWMLARRFRSTAEYRRKGAA